MKSKAEHASFLIAERFCMCFCGIILKYSIAEKDSCRVKNSDSCRSKLWKTKSANFCQKPGGIYTEKRRSG